MSLPFVSGGIQLRQLLPEAEFLGTSDVWVHRCVGDPYQIQPGDVWVAVPRSAPKATSSETKKDNLGVSPKDVPSENNRTISPADLAEAVARGAAAIVAEQPFPGLAIPQVVTPDPHEALGRICHALAGHPSKTLKVIAVTGRMGTAPTCWLLRRVLAEAGYRPGLLSSLGTFDGKTWGAPDSAAGPEPLAGQLARLVAQKCTHAVVEVSAGALAERALAGMELDVVCLTDWSGHGPTRKNMPIPGRWVHSSRAEISVSRAERLLTLLQTGLFRYLTAEGVTVLSADDPVSALCLRFLDSPVLTVGMRRMAEITGQLLEQQLAEQTFLLQAGTDVTPVRTRRIGQEHILDCLLAAAVGLAYGIDLPQVIRALELVETVPGHLERIEQGQPFAVFVDFARSRMALEERLRSLRRWCRGRLLCVVGAPLRWTQKAAALSRLLSHCVDKVFLTTEASAKKSPEGEIPHVVRLMLDRFEEPNQAHWIGDRGEAIYTALRQAQPGDCVLVVSHPMKTYPLPYHKSVGWDDRQVIRFCLEMIYPAGLLEAG